MSLRKSFLIVSSLLFIPFSAFAGNLEDGISLYKSGKYDKAIEVLNKAVKEDPENPEPHLWLSKSYESLLQLEKVFPETKLYNDLKYKKAQKDKAEAEKKAEEELKKSQENVAVEVTDNKKIILLNPNYLSQIISKRNSADEVRNLKFLDYKTVRDFITSVPNDTDALNRLYKEYQIKEHYGIATPAETIMMNKAKLDLIAYDIESKKLEISQEIDAENKKVKQSELDRLINDYNSLLEIAEKNINQPVYVNSESIGYDYFVASETPADVFVQTLEDKKTTFKPLIDSMLTDIKTLKKSVDGQEKDMLLKKQGLAPELLDADLRTIEGDNKEKVALYQTLRDKLESDKTKLSNLIMESDILVKAYNNMNSTIKKIKPDYIIKNISSK